MRRSFHLRLINDPFSDPGLYVSFPFERKAVLFDLGDIRPLSPRDILKVTHVFVTHTHMDHFIGFDMLLRVFLGRDSVIHLYGPPGFFNQVEGKLSGYTWNLVQDYCYNLVLKVTEVRPDETCTRHYLCNKAFRWGEEKEEPFNGLLLKEPGFHVRSVLLDHKTPCLGFRLVEEFHVNVIKEGLADLGIPVGPWLTEFKKALHEDGDPDWPFVVNWGGKGRPSGSREFPLGDLARRIARISPGQDLVYLADIIGSPQNLEMAASLARRADYLFIESAFLDCDAETARRKYHLTAKEAGEIARKAGVKSVVPFHFSPRYAGREEELRKEVMEAFQGPLSP